MYRLNTKDQLHFTYSVTKSFFLYCLVFVNVHAPNDNTYNNIPGVFLHFWNN